MKNKTSSKINNRKWTEISEDIGIVLRNQIVDRRNKSLRPIQLRQSLAKFVKGISNAGAVSSHVKLSQKPIFHNKRLSTEQFTLKYAKQTYLNRKDEDQYSSQEYIFEHTEPESKVKTMHEAKKKQANLLRSFLTRLKHEKQFNKIYNQREKNYRIWRLRAEKMVANNTQK